MKINILTLFPDSFAPFNESIISRASDKGLLDINLIQIRDYAADQRGTVDDIPYGGGAGMVMKPEPIMDALKANGYTKGDTVILTSPSGRKFTQKDAKQLSKENKLFVICGHYEGIDDRVRQLTDGVEYSIGDFVLTGGELPAMVMVDSIVRLVPSVLGSSDSLDNESFNNSLLEYPQYTRACDYGNIHVPDVLQNGNHKLINEWRHAKSLQKTWANRPDLLSRVPLTEDDKSYLDGYVEAHANKNKIFITLVHYPVLDPKGNVINTSLTNLDLHDIARLSATYEVEKYYIVQPGVVQKSLALDLVEYWTTGYGSRANLDRKAAIDKVLIVDSIDDVNNHIQENYGTYPITIATTAKTHENVIGYDELRHEMEIGNNNYLLMFGTGHGLTSETLDSADYLLKPIEGRGSYNHLSVRSAVSIIIDRLLGIK